MQLTMAETLHVDLIARGIRTISLGECEAIAARLVDRIAAARGDDAPPRRCDSSECDLDGSCMACGAIQGEYCLRPDTQ